MSNILEEEKIKIRNILIGYQGEIGSNAEEAAKRFILKFGLANVELIPLVNSKPVIENLENKNIDYAVVAIKNSIAGIVEETVEVIKDKNLEIIDKEIIPIHHCLFKKKEVKTEDIEIIASHIQALNQTKENRKKYFPNCQEKEMKDTALAARLLSEGKLSNKHAVLCRKETGEMYKLELIKENLEDNKDNYTEFHIYKIAE